MIALPSTSYTVRARLSADDLRELRRLALDLDLSVPEVVGMVIRDALVTAGRPVTITQPQPEEAGS